MIVDSSIFSKVLSILSTQQLIFVDVETDGFDAYAGNQICGIGLGISSGATYYFSFRHKHPDSQNLPLEYLNKVISTLNTTSILIGYNIKFDLHMLIREGLVPWDKQLIDVIVAVRLIETDRFPELGLKETTARWYGEKSSEYNTICKTALKKNKWNKNFSLSPETILGPYCEQDVFWTRKIYLDSIKKIHDTNQEVVWSFEIELTKVLLKMEYRGALIDREYCKVALEKIDGRKHVVQDEIYKEAKCEFDILSPKQLGIVFHSLNISSPEKTNKGNESWNEVALFQLEHPLAGKIREYRTLEHMANTYLSPLLESEVIHTTFCNWGTITGRLSSKEPNLQNIPRYNISTNNVMSEEQALAIRERIAAMLRARKGGGGVGGASLSAMLGFTSEENFNDADIDKIAIRRLFIPRVGYKLVSFDYSQMEVRVFVSYFNKDFLKLMVSEDFDFHDEAAKFAFNSKKTDVDFHFYRQMAKAITFGVIYGIGVKKLAAQLGKSEEEAKQYKNEYFKNIKGSRNFIYSVTNAAKNRGYVKNRFGRRYGIPEGREYVAVNFLIQGTSADILSIQMLELDKYYDSVDSHMLIQVHDELICEIPENRLNEISKRTKEILEDNSLGIPLVIETSLCDPSWAHKKKYDIIV
ncbi:MAG: DNA polymerase [Nanoarchaeota archaeon]